MPSAKMLRRGPSLARNASLAALSVAALMTVAPSQVQAQELVHRFINPSFGGNPFYSDHLVGIANIHRPDEPEDPAEPAPSEEDALAEQIRSSLNSQAVSEILDRIRGATPGQSGEFTLGATQISFARTQTETRVTFFNSETRQTRTVVVPVQNAGGAFGSASAAQASPEQALGALGSVPAGPLTGATPSSLLSQPPL